jgi:hypothetical protein
MQFIIRASKIQGWGNLLSDCVPRIDGSRFAVLITSVGLVFGESREKSEFGAAETRLYMVRDSILLRTTIEGKAYKPNGMKKLAVEFAGQCAEGRVRGQ